MQESLLTGWYIYGDVIMSRVFVKREHSCNWSLWLSHSWGNRKNPESLKIIVPPIDKSARDIGKWDETSMILVLTIDTY